MAKGKQKKPNFFISNFLWKFEQCLFGLLIFLIPSNLFLKLFEHTAYVHSLLIDYLLPKIYISDVVIVALFLIWFFTPEWRRAVWRSFSSFIQTDRQKLLMGGFCGLWILLFGLQFLTAKPFASLWFFLKLSEIAIFAVGLTHRRSLLHSLTLTYTVLVTLLFQSLLAIFQFWTQSSFFPSYYFFGEPNLHQFWGLSTGTFWGQEKILPYGTTAHPNILGGFLSIGLLILISQRKKLSKMWLLALPLIFFAFILTQSITAWLTLVIGSLIFLRRPKQRILLTATVVGCIFIPITLHFAALQYPSLTSFTRRASLNQMALAMWQKNFFTGVGLNNFTVQSESYISQPEIVRFVQPVHHVGLLWLAETGLLGIVLIIVILMIISQKRSFSSAIAVWTAALLPILTLDHYLLTQQTGLLIGVLFFYFISNEE
jgi:O-antigen ligase